MVGRTVDLSPSRETAAKHIDDALMEPVSTIENGKETAETVNEANQVNPEGSVDEQTVAPKTKTAFDLITIKVKDFYGVLGPTEAQLFVLSSDTTFGDFFIDVSCRFNLELGNFDIIYQDRSFSYNLAGFPEDQTFEAINIIPDRDKTYWMSLDMIHQKKRKIRSSTTTDTSGTDDTSTIALDICHKRDFVGLKNRNMTCYLNSFLQGLWFTPEFRNALLNFVYEPTRFNRKSLCYPLQKLFLQQQFSIRDSIETDDLIKTFGWEDRETWNQHDIEELCSIFMENLTAEFKGTPLEGIIQSLYFGTLDDYVKCLKCGRVSQRSDDFLVVPLPIRNFGSPLASPTLEAALNSFVAYEVLDGNNMYNCSQCNEPCAAHKGLKFNRLPYILTIQLKRFEYDFFKDRRLKLNDRVAFPFILDMNSYIENPSPPRRENLKADLLMPESMKIEGGRKTHSRPTISLVEEEDDTSSPEGGAAGGEKALLAEQMAELVKTKGPEIYQLYGVMVHRGGINSGHYYAYILDFERGKWFRCDDAAVRKASVQDIEGAYGGDSDEDRELTSAYMLLYRRFDPELNMLPYYLEDMPKHMQDMWEVTAASDTKLHEEEELAKHTVRMTCFFVVPSTNELLEKILAVPKTMTLNEAAEYAYQEFCPDANSESPKRGSVRLCRYDRDLGIVENSFEGHEDTGLVTVLRLRPAITKNEGFLLQLKCDEADHFPVYRHDDIIFRTHLANCYSEDMFNMQEIHAQSEETVGDLIKRINYHFKLEDCGMALVAHFSGRYGSIAGEKYPLSLFKLERINDLYVQQGKEEELTDLLFDFVEKYTKAEVIEIYIQAPHGFNVELASAAEPDIKPPVEVAEKAVSSISTTLSKNLNNGATTEATEANSQSDGVVTAGSEPSEKKLASRRNEHYIKFININQSATDNFVVCTLRIDGHTPLYSLSKRLSKTISVPEEEFVIYKVDRTETVELRRMTERICTIKPIDRLIVKQEHRLQDGESRVSVHLLSIGCIDKPLEYLMEVVATLRMTVDEVKAAIMQKYDALQTDATIDKTRLRIRKKMRTNPSKIMRANTKLQDMFTASSIQSGEIYLQILDQPAELLDGNYCLIYRHWHPSTGMLDSAIEITIFHDHSESLEEVILKKLRESLGLGDDVELEAAKPDTGYPWDISPRLIQDLAWFSLNPPVKKSLYVYNDELALFVRDKNELPKDFDTDDLEAYRPHNMLKPTSSSGDEPLRREPGLKLNLAKSP